MSDSLNILLITCDQLRSDWLGCYGHATVRTPNLDMLARNGGTRFTQAYTSVPSCIPSRAALISGLSQSSHGRVGYKSEVEFSVEQTLPRAFSQAGYHTQGVGKMHFYPARKLSGFHNVVLHDGYLHNERQAHKNYELVDDYLPWLKSKEGEDADYLLHGINANSWVARPWHYGEHTHPTTWATTMAIDFLRRRDPTKPFFLWLSFVRPHPPFDPPHVYWDMYFQEKFEEPAVGSWASASKPFEKTDGVSGIFDAEDLRLAKVGYAGCITHMDHQIGRLMEYLGEYGVRNETVVLFTSDHGEMLGDHHYFRKGLPYEGAIKIPLIINQPGKEQVAENNSLVELRDVFPTLTDLGGLDTPADIDGTSCVPALSDENLQIRKSLHGEHTYEELSSHFVISERKKLVWFPVTNEFQFFDLAHDPKELNDLYSQADHEKHLQLLIESLSGREEGFVVNGQLNPDARPKLLLNHVEH